MSTIVVNPHITDAEWEVMRVVWANGRVTSKEIISIFYLIQLEENLIRVLLKSYLKKII